MLKLFLHGFVNKTKILNFFIAYKSIPALLITFVFVLNIANNLYVTTLFNIK